MARTRLFPILFRWLRLFCAYFKIIMFFIVGVVSLWLDIRATKALDLSVKIMHFPTESSIYLIDFIRSDRLQMKIYVTGSDSLQTKCVCKRTAHFSGIISFEGKKTTSELCKMCIVTRLEPVQKHLNMQLNRYSELQILCWKTILIITGLFECRTILHRNCMSSSQNNGQIYTVHISCSVLRILHELIGTLYKMCIFHIRNKNPIYSICMYMFKGSINLIPANL